MKKDKTFKEDNIDIKYLRLEKEIEKRDHDITSLNRDYHEVRGLLTGRDIEISRLNKLIKYKNELIEVLDKKINIYENKIDAYKNISNINDKIISRLKISLFISGIIIPLLLLFIPWI